MTTYLVGLDGSQHAAEALAWARAEAIAQEQIVVVHATDPAGGVGYDGGSSTEPVDTDETSRDLVAGMLGQIDDDRLDGRVTEGPAGRALLDVAGTLGSDVVIVVGHGGTGKASLLLGSTAHHVIHHTDHPVVVVRGESRLPVRNLVVGVDGFDEHDEPDARSMAALRFAVELPGVERIEVSHADFVPGVAAGPVREPGLESDEATGEEDNRLRHAIEEATGGTGVAASGATIVPVVAAGTGAFALIEASRDADLVVIGTRGRSGLMELIVGSTTLEVLAHAHCPVAVVH